MEVKNILLIFLITLTCNIYAVNELNFGSTYLSENLPFYEEAHIVAHSMGAAIAILYAQIYPQQFRKLALNSPMIHIITSNIPRKMADWFFSGLKLMGKKTDYTPGNDYLIESDSIRNPVINKIKLF